MDLVSTATSTSPVSWWRCDILLLLACGDSATRIRGDAKMVLRRYGFPWPCNRWAEDRRRLRRAVSEAAAHCMHLLYRSLSPFSLSLSLSLSVVLRRSPSLCRSLFCRRSPSLSPSLPLSFSVVLSLSPSLSFSLAISAPAVPTRRKCQGIGEGADSGLSGSCPGGTVPSVEGRGHACRVIS